MKTIFRISTVILIILFIHSCKKEKPTPPVITTTTVTAIFYTTATSGGDVTNEGGAPIISRGVCWNTSADPTIANSKTTESGGSGAFTSNLTQLTPNTMYYVRAYATNSVGTGYGNQVSFTTIQVAVPVLTTTAITSIAQTSAISGGNITTDNGGSVTARGVCWGTATNPTTSNSKTTDGTGTGSFVSNLIGLQPGTIYYVRSYATNSVGTSYGNEISFITLATVPTLTTTAVSSITQTTATSGGDITSDGGATITTRGVCWSTSQNPTIANNITTNGSGTGSFTSSIIGLTGNTTYYVRAYATNASGTGYGMAMSFTTTVITWEKTFGGENYDGAFSAQQTSDGGYIVAGYRNGTPINRDLWIVKLNSYGNIVWEKTFGSRYGSATSIRQTTDGGYIVAGNVWMSTGSWFTVLKLYSNGNLEWEYKEFDGIPYSVRQTPDGGYIVAGVTNRNSSISTYIRIVKLDPKGNKVWVRNIDTVSSGYKAAYDILPTTDGGYVIVGEKRNIGMFFFKLDSQGNSVSGWVLYFGSVLYSVEQTTDGGYIVAGKIRMVYPKNNDNLIIAKIEPNTANRIWERVYGENDVDLANEVQQTTDGGYIVAGVTFSKGAGFSDAWVLKLDEKGQLE